MILINLLPHRAEKRRQRKRAFYLALGASALAGAVVVGLWSMWLQHLTGEQMARNDFLRQETAKLEAQIKDIASLRAEIENLKARQDAVEDLQINRNVPVYLLDELVRQTPEGIYLKSIRQADQVVTVSGVAQSNERVSELLRNVQNASRWLQQPELIEIRAVAPPVQRAGARVDTRRLYEFSMKVQVKLPGAAASAPVAAGSAAVRKST
ncbi:MAG: fimbrial assembly protein [Pseudomonadota bacterium]|uniref:PilN domain-containing protein n=1 Tax=Pseudaquabacterium rugosum TaxID=2984194 RepID=A0ABU9B494_9BURK|nr:type pilus assembly protein PilN [Pseudomonadota bacterium]